jgi:nitrite reductase/ring-hydroxylating ferredoxin subunit
VTTNKKYQWHKVAESIAEINFSSNGLASIEVDNKTICVVLHNDALLACTNKCPHAGGLMEHGFVDAMGNIICPLHRYKFRLKNGHNISGEGYHLKTYPVEIREDGVFVGFAQNNLFGI